jgi:predicted branched-subunit amino acid permease
MGSATETPDTLADGIRAALPLILPTVLIGASFGVAASTAGWGDLAPVVMSVIVFSGAAQFTLLTVLVAGGSIITAIAAATLITLRFLALGLAIGPSIRGSALRRAAVGWTTTDASIVLARTGEARYGPRRLVGSFLPQFAGWTIGTWAGVVVGGRIPDPERYGLDALFPAFFCVLLAGELRDPAARVSAAVAALIAVVLIPIAPPGLPVIAACLAVAAGRLVRAPGEAP